MLFGERLIVPEMYGARARGPSLQSGPQRSPADFLPAVSEGAGVTGAGPASPFMRLLSRKGGLVYLMGKSGVSDDATPPTAPQGLRLGRCGAPEDSRTLSHTLPSEACSGE